ncbi:MAG TPA: DUF4232 domain-containing protein [Streptosporangiaceae bacterium]|jgi:hypothetical protein|nr:DUF4232 domain-containing protein [Streptosporangiaceae bacterium]
MRRSVKAVAVLVALMVGGCGSGTGVMYRARPAPAGQRPSSGAGGAARPATETGVPRCAARALVLRPGAFVVPMTGEHAVMYALTNRGLVACTLSGYPQVVLYDAKGAALPFRYARGGGAYVTSRKPAPVVLARGASAYVLVAKYRCDFGIVRNATAMRLILPGARGAAFTAQEAVASGGAVGLSYCRGGQRDPGQLVTVSPVEPTRQATSSLR